MIIENLFFKKIVVALLVIAILIPSLSFTTLSYFSSNDILGVYQTPNKRSQIEFIEKEGLYYGVLVWNVNPEIKDKFNLDKNLKDKNLIGQAIFKAFKYNKYERNWSGKFYDTESGITYNCNLWLENRKQNLMARGYIENPLIGRTAILKRVEE